MYVFERCARRRWRDAPSPTKTAIVSAPPFLKLTFPARPSAAGDGAFPLPSSIHDAAVVRSCRLPDGELSRMAFGL